MRPTLCLPTDVLRKFDPQVTEEALRTVIEGTSPIGTDDYERIVSRIEGVESRVERETGRPYQRRTKGRPNNDQSWVVPNRTELRTTRPYPRIYVNLPDDEIVSITELQVRSEFQFDDGPDTVSVDNYDLNPTDGTINIRRSIIPSAFWRHIEHRGYNVRVKYEYGAVGGRHDVAGQTETSENIDDEADEVTVDNGSRLPPDGTVLIGQEYAAATVDGDTLSLEERGVRGTTTKSHDSGTGVHYCPMHVREAVAALAAIEMVTYVDRIDKAVGEQFDPQEKRDTWQDEWHSLIETAGEFSAL